MLPRLAGVLNVDFPHYFSDFVSSFIQVFRFDFTVKLGLGRITDGTYIPSILANVGLVIMVLLAVAVTHIVRMRKITKGNIDEKSKSYDSIRFRTHSPKGAPMFPKNILPSYSSSWSCFLPISRSMNPWNRTSPSF